MSRLFTFGCSYTEYIWPTWADIIAFDLHIPYENWGMSGIGNVGIAHRIVECDIRNNFNEDDLILILWSSWNREDRLTRNSDWSIGGSIFNNSLYDKSFIDKYWSLGNDIVKNSTAIILIDRCFNINFQGHILPITHFESLHINFNEKEKEIFDFYKARVNAQNIFPDSIHDSHKVKLKDAHPDVLDHLSYVEKFVYPVLKRTIRSDTKNYFLEMHEFMVDFINWSKKKNISDRLILSLKEKYNFNNSMPHGW